MTATRKTESKNRLLAALPDKSQVAMRADCERVKLTFGDILCESGDKIRHVYFPLDGFISLVTTLDDGTRLEVGLVGDEGMLGTALVLGVNISPQLAIVQGAGTALRMTAAAFLKHQRQIGTLREVLARYVYVLMSQLAQTAACTHYHVVEARLARWLLMTRDRAHADKFHLTHEFLAYMLGVRRVGITQAASALHRQGLITYTRGEITILDGEGLEAVTCGCYEQGNELYDKALRLPRRAH